MFLTKSLMISQFTQQISKGTAYAIENYSEWKYTMSYVCVSPLDSVL